MRKKDVYQKSTNVKEDRDPELDMDGVEPDDDEFDEDGKYIGDRIREEKNREEIERKKSNRPIVLPVNFDSIPNGIKKLKQWVLWIYYWSTKQNDWSKLPIKVNHKAASSTDSDTWDTYEVVSKVYQKDTNPNVTGDPLYAPVDGIGIVATKETGLVLLDLDNAFDSQSGKLKPWAEKIVRLYKTYTEISPSGKGIRMLGWGKLPDKSRHKRDLEDGVIEIYDHSRYVTITGQWLDIDCNQEDLCDIQTEVDTFLEEYFPEKERKQWGSGYDYVPSPEMSDEEIIELLLKEKGGKAKDLWKGNFERVKINDTSPSGYTMSLISKIATHTQDVEQIDRIFRQSATCENNPKWEERQDYRDRTIQAALDNLTWTYGPHNSREKKSTDTVVDFDLKIGKLPVLDPRALHGIAGQVVELACRYSEAGPAAVLGTFLTLFAAEVPRPQLWVGDTVHHARLFTTIVGGSSKSRKGTSVKPVERIFSGNDETKRIFSGYLFARTSPGPLSSGEGLVYNVRDAVKEYIVMDRKTQSREWVEVDPGITDKRLCVIDEEFGAALSCTKREGNTLSTIMRQAWDSGNIEPLTKNNRIKSTGAHLNVVTHITNAELQQKLHETEALNGFGNRFLWVYAWRQKLVSRPQAMPEDEVNQLRDRIIKACNKVLKRDVTMTFSDESWSMWDKIYPELSKDHLGLSGTITNRAEAQVIRLSMVYALLDECTIIETCHLEAALAFWQYCEQSALFVFGGRESDVIADKILQALKERGDLTSTQINELFHHNVQSSRIQFALRELANSGRITSCKDKEPDANHRPTIKYTLLKDLELQTHTYELNELNEISTSE